MWFLALKATFGLILISLGAWGMGVWIYDVMPSTFKLWERMTIGLLGGFGLVSLVLFLVGHLLFTRTTIMVVLVAAAVPRIKSLWRLFKSAQGLSNPRTVIPKLSGAIVVSVLALTAVTGLEEVTGDWNNDTVAYHLLGPKVWIRNGIIRPVPDNSHTAFPATAETLYAALLTVGGTSAPGFSSVATFGLLLLVSSSLAIRCGLNRKEAWWVAALISTMPAVYSGSVRCFVDGIYAAFVLAAIRVGVEAVQLSHWAVFGVFCGLAIGTKYTGVLAFPALIFCIFAVRMEAPHEDWHLPVKKALFATAVACAIGAPYYLRNWILLGCPIYPPPPGFAHICSPKYLSPEVVAQFHAYIRQRGAGLGRSFIAFLLLPFNLTYHTADFHGAGGIGLCPLALGPLGLIASWRNTFVRAIALLGSIFLFTWFVTQQESRFLIPVYVILAIFSVLGWRYALLTRDISSRWLSATLVTLSLSYGIFMIGRSWSQSVRAVVSPAFAEMVRAKNIPFRESFQYLNNSPSVKKVLILDRSVPPYYCEKDYIKPIGQWGEQALPGVSTSLQALEQVRNLNVSHVLDVNSDVAPFQLVVQTDAFSLVFESKNQRIYKVN